MDVKGYSNEASEGNEEHIIGNWRKGGSCYKLTKILAELRFGPRVLWKVELSNNEIGYLAELVSKQSVEGAASFLLSAYSEV